MSQKEDLFKEPITKAHRNSVLAAMERELPRRSPWMSRFLKLSPVLAAAMTFAVVLWLRPAEEDIEPNQMDDLNIANFLDHEFADDFEMFIDEDMEIVELLSDQDLEV